MSSREEGREVVPLGSQYHKHFKTNKDISQVEHRHLQKYLL